MPVLLIEDDVSLAKIIELSLTAEGMASDIVALGEDGLALAKLNQYSLVILDLILPDINGYDIIRSIRALQPATLILILSGLGTSEEKVRGLNAGADDYITKPFNRKELLSRIKGITNRNVSAPIGGKKLTINHDNHTTYIDGKLIHLANKEQAFIETLAASEKVFSKKELMLSIYSSEDEMETKILDILAAKVNKKLSAFSNGMDYIESINGDGYILR